MFPPRAYAIVSVAFSAIAVAKGALADGGDGHLRLFRAATCFATSQAGRAREPSPISREFSRTVRHGRVHDFLVLSGSDQPAARLYGLCGLKALHAPEYSEIRRRLATDPAQVRVLVGCIRRHETVQTTLTRSYSGGEGPSVFDTVCDTLERRRHGR